MKSEGEELLSKVAMGCTTILKQHNIYIKIQDMGTGSHS